MVRIATFAAGVATGAFLVGVAVILLGPWWVPATNELLPPVPRLSTTGPVVRNGVVAIAACGKKRGFEVVGAAPEARTGTWAPDKKGDCTVWYHHPPEATQREARQQRAQEE